MELMIIAFLHKMDNSDWTEEELSPIRHLEVMEISPTASPLGVEVTIQDSKKYLVDFHNMDGRRTC
jgi:hypothetical protein